MRKDPEKLAQKIEIEFKNSNLLHQSMVHRSYLNEHKDFELGHNERLEFLGDAVLELIVTELLFHAYENPEGELTNWRAALVNAKMLAEIAKKIGIEPYLHLSKGESQETGTKARDYILANALEALIGAIYLDKGYKVTKEFIETWVWSNIDRILEHGLYLDPKSRFQESAQEHANITPTYRVMKEGGPDHNKHFVVGVFLDKELVAEGAGTSKQEGQEAAAENALKVKKWKGPTINVMRR